MRVNESKRGRKAEERWAEERWANERAKEEEKIKKTTHTPDPVPPTGEGALCGCSLGAAHDSLLGLGICVC